MAVSLEEMEMSVTEMSVTEMNITEVNITEMSVAEMSISTRGFHKELVSHPRGSKSNLGKFMFQ